MQFEALKAEKTQVSIAFYHAKKLTDLVIDMASEIEENC